MANERERTLNKAIDIQRTWRKTISMGHTHNEDDEVKKAFESPCETNGDTFYPAASRTP